MTIIQRTVGTAEIEMIKLETNKRNVKSVRKVWERVRAGQYTTRRGFASYDINGVGPGSRAGDGIVSMRANIFASPAVVLWKNITWCFSKVQRSRRSQTVACVHQHSDHESNTYGGSKQRESRREWAGEREREKEKKMRERARERERKKDEQHLAIN